MNPKYIIDKKPCVRIVLTDTKPEITGSKIGGMGYLPHDGEIPRTKDGIMLNLLAQINCSEVNCPNCPDFPDSGLLQFWILSEDLYGWDFHHPTTQDGFRVLYYPEIDETVTRQEIAVKYQESQKFRENQEEWILPFAQDMECGMTFQPSESNLIDWDAFYEDEEDEESEKDEEIDIRLHQIGGYPFFTQDDPRPENSDYSFLLFQLDSQMDSGEHKIFWGDFGVGNFFIKPEKLKQCDFSDVWYNWDCY